MFVCDLTIFAGPTEYSGWGPRDDSVCSKSLIGYREGRMIKALRRLQCFVKLGMILRSRVHNVWALERARCQVQCRDQVLSH